mmetsp:Transcript_77564/g.179824  ORF Transcript_77564/g.179824 Transcript_77564/m.179824 type:complete len:193 (+) Transcript_77564:128-706(+)|eukprot:CAMPEP_0171090656 /NCGR_PEP_ID=MMETSP0766_2-20121228/31991_1 /TAXON_ID=439317 /ORGANISM="Gambierdiscus australes, Strain CAWD 149" /LENGTH=192 /DNA_ID=CAMNT_0011548677 /DNA_START=124 /DNA_END=702 /DNA_ORIENTATION=-
MAARCSRALAFGLLPLVLLVVVSRVGLLSRSPLPAFLSASSGVRAPLRVPVGLPASSVLRLEVGRTSRLNLVMRRLRLVGKEIPRNKGIAWALMAAIFGIGKTTAFKILKDCAIDPDKKTYDLSEDEELRLSEELGKYTLENPLKRMYKANCQLLLEIKHRRGVRMQKGLPARWQRSKTNNRTSRKMNPWRV